MVQPDLRYPLDAACHRIRSYYQADISQIRRNGERLIRKGLIPIGIAAGLQHHKRPVSHNLENRNLLLGGWSKRDAMGRAQCRHSERIAEDSAQIDIVEGVHAQIGQGLEIRRKYRAC